MCLDSTPDSYRAYHHAYTETLPDIQSQGLHPTHYQQEYQETFNETPLDSLEEAASASCPEEDEILLCRATVERMLEEFRPEHAPERDGCVFLYPSDSRETAERVVNRRDDLTLLEVTLDAKWTVWQSRSDFFGRPYQWLIDTVRHGDPLTRDTKQASEWLEEYWAVAEPYEGETTLPLQSGAAFEARAELFVPRHIPPENVEVIEN